VFCEGIVGWEQDGRLRAGERRDAVKGVEGDAQVCRGSVHDALFEQFLVVGGIGSQEVASAARK
jgi:hypothetical protein